MVRVFAAILLAVAASAVSVAPAHACSCVHWDGLREAVTSAELAFVGTPIGEGPAGRNPPHFGPLIATTFRVDRASTETAPRLEVAARPGGDEGACGFSFDLHQRWLVMTHRSDGLLMTSSCADNRPLSALAPADLALLDELLPHVPAAAVRESSERASSPLSAPMLLIGGAAAVLAVGGILAFRRHPGR